MAALIDQRRAQELLQEPPTPEEQAEAEGARGVVRAALDDFMGRLKSGDKMGESDIDALLAKGVSRAMAMQLLKQMSSDTAPAPVTQPSTTELTGMLTAAAQVSSTAATTAIARETATRQELTQTVAAQDQRIATAVSDERNQGVQYAGLIERILTNEKEQAVSAVKAQSDAALAEMRKLAADAIAAKDATIAAIEKHSAIQLQLKEKDHAHALALRDKDDALRAAQAQVPHAATPDEQWRAHQLNTAIEDDKDARAHEREMRAGQRRILGKIEEEVVPQLGPTLNTIVSAITGQPVNLGGGAPGDDDGPPPRPEEGSIDVR